MAKKRSRRDATPPLPQQPKLRKKKKAGVTAITLFKRAGSRFWQVRIKDGSGKPVRRTTGKEIQASAEDFARLLHRHIAGEGRKQKSAHIGQQLTMPLLNLALLDMAAATLK